MDAVAARAPGHHHHRRRRLPRAARVGAVDRPVRPDGVERVRRPVRLLPLRAVDRGGPRLRPLPHGRAHGVLPGGLPRDPGRAVPPRARAPGTGRLPPRREPAARRGVHGERGVRLRDRSAAVRRARCPGRRGDPRRVPEHRLPDGVGAAGDDVHLLVPRRGGDRRRPRLASWPALDPPARGVRSGPRRVGPRATVLRPVRRRPVRRGAGRPGGMASEPARRADPARGRGRRAGAVDHPQRRPPRRIRADLDEHRRHAVSRSLDGRDRWVPVGGPRGLCGSGSPRGRAQPGEHEDGRPLGARPSRARGRADRAPRPAHLRLRHRRPARRQHARGRTRDERAHRTGTGGRRQRLLARRLPADDRRRRRPVGGAPAALTSRDRDRPRLDGCADRRPAAVVGEPPVPPAVQPLLRRPRRWGGGVRVGSAPRRAPRRAG